MDGAQLIETPLLDGYVKRNLDGFAAGNRIPWPLGMNFDVCIAFIGVEQSDFTFYIVRRIFRVITGLHGAIRNMFDFGLHLRPSGARATAFWRRATSRRFFPASRKIAG